MFWFKKKKSDKQSKPATKAGSSASDGVGTKNKGQRLSSEEIRAQALVNAREARQRVGDETIQRIAAALVQKKISLTEQAKEKIAQANSERVVDKIRLLLDGYDDNVTRH